MAISYSYPMGTPKLTDTVLGVQYEEMKDPAVKNFSIDDIVVLAAAEITPTPGPAGPQGPQGTTGATGSQGSQGAQGIQGLAGTVGPAGLEWQGAWEFDSTYNVNDAVSFAGASYFCILNVDTNSNPPPDEDTTHWALLAAQGAPGLQGIQGIQGIQGPAGAQGPQGIQGIQGIPGTSATQTLQQTVDLGNTISGIAGGVTFTTTLTNTSVKVGASTISGMTLNTTQLISEKNSGSDLMVLQFPSVYSGVNQITLPAATGTVALTSDVTLQKAITGGNTITDGYNIMTVTAESIKTNNFLGGQIEVVGGISTANPYIKFGLPSSAGKTVTLTSADTQTASRTIKLPDNDGTIALTTDIPTPAYKIYTALLFQNGTDAPTATVLQNTLGGTINWSRSGVGTYLGTLTGGIFTDQKTVVFTQVPGGAGASWGFQYITKRQSNTEVYFITQIGDSTSTTVDDALSGTPIEIRVYN
jgi:hypothetical protein